MAKRRYSALKRARYLSKKLNASGKPTGDPIIGEDTALSKFNDYALGKIDLTYPKNNSSKVKELVPIVVIPFAKFATGLSEGFIVKLSKRAQEEPKMNDVRASANLSAVTENDDRVIGFTPAKAYVSLVAETQVSTDKRESQITGINYDPIDKESWTIPLGAGTDAATGHYLDVKKAITTKVGLLTPGKGKVRFKNEII